MKLLCVILTMVIIIFCEKLQSQETAPEIVYSTYYGNQGTDDADAVTVDSDGNIYLGCHSNSADLPGTEEQPYSLKGGMDAFVIKLNSTGTTIGYFTHVGGSEWDAVQGLVSDSKGNIYAVGTTYSSDFSIKPNGFQSKFGGKSDAFILKLDTSGKIVWSTFLGGSEDEDGRDIAIDQHDNVHIIGRTASKDFPISGEALQSRSAGGVDAFVAKFDANGKMLSTTYLGGSGDDIGFSMVLDDAGRRYIAGTTNSTDFPVNNAFQSVSHGENDLFFAIIDTTGSTLEFASYLGGEGADQVYSIDLGPSGDVYLMGVTSSQNYPTSTGAYQPILSGERDAFISRLNLEKKRIVYSTYLGGNSHESPRKLLVDQNGNAILIGQTASANFPTANNRQTELRGPNDAFVTMLDPSGSFLIYSSFFGGDGKEIFEGADFGVDGSLTLSGLSSSIDFPLVNPIQDTFLGGRFDIVVTRLIFNKHK